MTLPKFPDQMEQLCFIRITRDGTIVASPTVKGALQWADWLRILGNVVLKLLESSDRRLVFFPDRLRYPKYPSIELQPYDGREYEEIYIVPTIVEGPIDGEELGDGHGFFLELDFDPSVFEEDFDPQVFPGGPPFGIFDPEQSPYLVDVMIETMWVEHDPSKITWCKPDAAGDYNAFCIGITFPMEEQGANLTKAECLRKLVLEHLQIFSSHATERNPFTGWNPGEDSDVVWKRIKALQLPEEVMILPTGQIITKFEQGLYYLREEVERK